MGWKTWWKQRYIWCPALNLYSFPLFYLSIICSITKTNYYCPHSQEALTSLWTASNSIYCCPHLQAQQSGILHAEDNVNLVRLLLDARFAKVGWPPLSMPLAFVLWLGIVGRCDGFVVKPVGRLVCAAGGGREYESRCMGTPESELANFKKGLKDSNDGVCSLHLLFPSLTVISDRALLGHNDLLPPCHSVRHPFRTESPVDHQAQFRHWNRVCY